MALQEKVIGSRIGRAAVNRLPSIVTSRFFETAQITPEYLLQQNLAELRKVADKLPETVVIIPDGNGRWAEEQGMTRKQAYEIGAEVLYEDVKVFQEFKQVKNFILWAWSEDNDKRGPEDREIVFGVIAEKLIEHKEELMANNCRVLRVGTDANFTPGLTRAFAEAYDAMKDNDGTNIFIGINYGERYENWRFAKKLKESGVDPDVATPEEVDAIRAQSCEIPIPDLIVRTSGEQRLSRFPFSNAAELVFINTKLPALRPHEIAQALREYANRERPEGGSRKPQVTTSGGEVNI